MKHNYAQKWTVSELSAIQKWHFLVEKIRFYFFKLFLHTFVFPKTDFLLLDHLFWIADNSWTVRFLGQLHFMVDVKRVSL